MTINTRAFNLCAVAIVASTAVADSSNPRDWTPGQLVARSSAVGLVRVASIKQVDARPRDGNLYESVTLEPIRVTGRMVNRIALTIRSGWPAESRTLKVGDRRIRPGQLEQDRRYWLAIRGQPQFQCSLWPEKYHPYDSGDPVLAWWPAEGDDRPDPEMLAALEKAVAEDSHAWDPQWVPIVDVTYEHLVSPESGTWQLRIRRSAQTLWSLAIKGEPSPLDPVEVYHSSQVPDLELVPQTASGLFLRVVNREKLGEPNQFELPAGSYLLERWHEVETGRLCAVQVLMDQAPRGELVFQAFDPETGQPVIDRRNEWVGTNRTDQWLRQTLHRYDGKNGAVLATEVFRYEGSRLVPVGPEPTPTPTSR